MRPPALMFGVPIADVTMHETIELIGELVELGRARQRTHQIATVNVDFLVNALDDPDTASMLQRADVCIADGMPVVWGARMLGMPIRERVAGADLVPRLVEASQRTGLHVHVFGSAPAVADEARALLAERYPRARFSIDPGPMIPDVEQVDDDVLDSIAAVDADILCIALGNPKQERFIRAHRDRLGAPVMMGVGGSLDMLVGKRRRAPGWVQRIGMEWVVRAAQEPRRLGRRYAHDIRVFGPTFAAALRASRKRRTGLGLRITDGDDGIEVHIGGTDVGDPSIWSVPARRIATGSTLTIDVGPGDLVRDTASAQLVGLVQLARRSGTDVSWTTPPGALVACFDEVGLTPLMLGLGIRWEIGHAE